MRCVTASSANSALSLSCSFFYATNLYTYVFAITPAFSISLPLCLLPSHPYYTCTCTFFHIFLTTSSFLSTQHHLSQHPLLLAQFSNSRDVPLVSLRRTTTNTTPGIGGGSRTLLYNSYNKAENNVLVTSESEVFTLILFVLLSFTCLLCLR